MEHGSLSLYYSINIFKAFLKYNLHSNFIILFIALTCKEGKHIEKNGTWLYSITVDELNETMITFI